MNRSQIRPFSLAAAAVIAFALPACDRLANPPLPPQQSRGGVAVVDLDEVAKRLGRDSELTEAIKKEEGGLIENLRGAEQELVKQLQEKQTELGEDAGEDALREFATLRQEAVNRFTGLQREAQAQLARKQTELVNRFREEVKPHAREAAKAQGLDVVLSKNDNVLLTFPSETDITEDVVVRMIKAAPAATSAATPESSPAAP